MSSLIKSKERVKDLGEVFTPESLVFKMLDKLPLSAWEKNKTFFEPSCGTGNILIVIFKQKIKNGSTPLEALNTIYGIDIMEDNVKESRKRLLKIALESNLKLNQIDIAVDIIKKNIILGNALEINLEKVWAKDQKTI